MKFLSNVLLVISLITIGGCGGSGSDAPTPPPTQPPANTAPTASVPANFDAIELSGVSLNGSGSSDSDGSISSYEWSQTGGTLSVALESADTATATFTAPEVPSNTQLTFQLTVLDNDGASASASVVVTVTPDLPPQAVAPADFNAVELTDVTLDGTSSSDDVVITSYLWTQTAGQSVTLTSQNTATSTFTAPQLSGSQPLDLTFDLTVTDASGASSTDTVVVTIVDAPIQITLSGVLTYDHVQHTASNALDYNNIIQSAVRGATVELLNSSSSAILDTTVSDQSGNYSFVISPNTSYVVRVKAELLKTGSVPTWNFTVVDNTNGKALYAMDSSTQSVSATSVTVNINAASGWTGSSYGNPRVAGSFAILDSIYEAKEKVVSVDASVVMPELKLNWSVNNVASGGDIASGQIGTSFFNGTEIFLLGDEDGDTDEYDGHVIVHEWGHYFEGRLSRSDSVGGSHSTSDRLDMRVALGEGWGNALSGIVTDDPFYRDSFGNGQSSGFRIDVESGTSSSVGWYSESSAFLLIYDFYDANDDGADTLSLGFAPIYNMMINGQRNTQAFTSIFSFVNQLKIESPANIATIDSMLAAQNIIVNDDFGTGETNTGGDTRNLPIYKVLSVSGTVEVCSYAPNGQQNKLGNRKYITLDIANTGSYTLTAVGQTAGDDPDLFLFAQGNLIFRSDVVGNESTTQTINSGQYTMEVFEFSNIQGTSRDTCIDVTITAN